MKRLYQFLRGIAFLNLVVPRINGGTADDSSLCCCRCHFWFPSRLLGFFDKTDKLNRFSLRREFLPLNKQREMLFLHKIGPYFFINHEFATPINGPLSKSNSMQRFLFPTFCFLFLFRLDGVRVKVSFSISSTFANYNSQAPTNLLSTLLLLNRTVFRPLLYMILYDNC